MLQLLKQDYNAKGISILLHSDKYAMILSTGVSGENIPYLIVSVINNLTTYKLSVSDLQPPSSIYTMNLKLGIISQKQISENIENETNLTILRDGKTKHAKRIYGIKDKFYRSNTGSVFVGIMTPNNDLE